MAKKIKVMHIVESLDVGGMENGVVNLSNNIDTDKFELSICCVKEIGELARRIDRSRTRIFELNAKGGKQLSLILKMRKLIKDNKIDILHTHGWGARSLIGIIGARLACVPKCINGEHGTLHIDKKSQLCIQKALIHLVDGTLSVSEGLKNKLINYLNYRPEQITVISNGVDIQRFCNSYDNAALIHSLGATKSDFIISVVGSLRPLKNQEVVCKAIKLLSDNGIKNVKLLLIGDGVDRKRLQDLVLELGIESNVKFLGKRHDVPELLSISNVLVLPSFSEYEGMSNAVLEGMASRTAVISTRSVGSTELISDGETGLFFKDNDHKNLAEKINLLRENEVLRNKIVGNAIERISADYSISRMVKDYENYYLRLMR